MTNPSVQEDPAVRLIGVTKRYPFFSLGPVDLELRAGRILGLLGENGAGKSTLLRLMLGLVRPDAGTVELLGLPMPEREHEIKSAVGFVSEDMSLYGGASIAWHLRFVRGLAAQWDEAYQDELLERFALPLRQRVRGLSRGQSVRLMLLLALVRRPRLLLLDEPTTGLDPRVRHELREELAQVSAERGTTIVFSSHLTEDVEAIAGEIAFVHRGRIVERGATRDLLARGPLEELFLAATPASALAIAGREAACA